MNLASHRQAHNNQALDQRPKTQPRPTPTETDESLEYNPSALWKLTDSAPAYLMYNLTTGKENVGLSKWQDTPEPKRKLQGKCEERLN